LSAIFRSSVTVRKGLVMIGNAENSTLQEGKKTGKIFVSKSGS